MLPLEESWERQFGDEVPAGYDPHEVLGRGGFGTVFRATHQRTGQSVALKVLRMDPSWPAQMRTRYVARFEREAALCTSLHHPNIVQLLDKGRTANGMLYMVYEYVPGETLSQLLARQGPLSAVEAGDLMAQVLDALACAHANGVVHRDLKPENVMVVRTGGRRHAKVLDFGIGTLLPEMRGVDHKDLTLSRELLGTPSYSAPEQLRGEPSTTKTDLYAWGLVFLECLTGRPVFCGATSAAIFHQQLSPQEVPIPPEIAGHSLAEFLRRVLQKRPERRASDAVALYTDIRSCHLADIVGVFDERCVRAPAVAGTTARTIATADRREPTELRQVTALACSVSVVPVGNATQEFEVLDALHRDQFGQICDDLTRFGGTLAWSQGNRALAYFGYPSAADTDGRRAARTALDLANAVRLRSERLIGTRGVALEFRVGLHTGVVLLEREQLPSGITPDRALRLEAQAPANTILLSASACRLLQFYVRCVPGPSYSASGLAAPEESFRMEGERRRHALTLRPEQKQSDAVVGRDMEQETLCSGWAQVEKGLGQAWLLSGEAGVGKSRLLAELAKHVRKRVGQVYEVRCHPEERNSALAPVLSFLRVHLGMQDAETPEAASAELQAQLQALAMDISVLLPIFCAWLCLPCPSELPPLAHAPKRQKELLLQATSEILRGGCADGPVLLVVEDVHWADPTTIDLLGLLLASHRECSMMVAMTARPEFDIPWAHVALNEMRVNRIDRSACSRLIRDRLGGRKVDAHMLDCIAERADGIPLFAEELTRMVAEAADQGRGIAEVHDSEIPITLRDLLTERLDRLGAAKELAQLASAIGRDFDGALLACASGWDEGLVAQELDRLTEADIVVQLRKVGGARFRFRHALIRDAAYGSVPREHLRHTHARIASALEAIADKRHRENAAELSRHHAAAGSFASAVEYGILAAEDLLQRSSALQAGSLAHTVLRWVERLPENEKGDAPRRAQSLLTQALIATEGWASTNVRQSIERTQELLAEGSPTPQVVANLYALFQHYHVASERRACSVVAEQLVEIAENNRDRALACVAATAQGVGLHAEGSFIKAAEHLERALSLYDPSEDASQGATYGLDCRAWAAAQLALVAWNCGDAERALRLANDAIDWSRQLGHVPSLGIALLYISQVHQFNDDRASVEATTTELLDLASTYGLPAFEGYAATLRAWAQDDLNGVKQVIGVLEAMNCNLILTYYGSFVADIHARRNQIEGAIEEVERCLALCTTIDEHCYEAELCRRRAYYESLSTTPDRGVIVASLRRSIQLARAQGMLRIEAMANLDLQRVLGQTPELRLRRREICQLRPELETVEGAYGTLARAASTNSATP